VQFDLKDRRILVVGASAGIGRSLAEVASEAGARVAVAARRRDRLEEVAKETGSVVVAGDVCVEGDCQRMVAETVDALGGLDALVYVTGVSPLKPLTEADQADWRHVLDTNVVGAGLMARHAVPHLLESRGKAVFVSSKATRNPFPGLGLYSISKIALDAFIRCLKVENPSLDVTRVVVGNTIDTEFASAWAPDMMERMVEEWAKSGHLGSSGLMHRRQGVEAARAVLSGRGYIDDIAIIDRDTDDGTW